MKLFKREKTEKAVTVPEGITAIFLVKNEEETKRLKNVLKDKKDAEYLIITGIKVLIRKDMWELVDS